MLPLLLHLPMIVHRFPSPRPTPPGRWQAVIRVDMDHPWYPKEVMICQRLPDKMHYEGSIGQRRYFSAVFDDRDTLFYTLSHDAIEGVLVRISAGAGAGEYAHRCF